MRRTSADIGSFTNKEDQTNFYTTGSGFGKSINLGDKKISAEETKIKLRSGSKERIAARRLKSKQSKEELGENIPSDSHGLINAKLS